MGQVSSGVWLSGSFQVSVLTQLSYRWAGKLSGPGNVDIVNVGVLDRGCSYLVLFPVANKKCSRRVRSTCYASVGL